MKSDLAGSWQKVQFDIGISQTIEIHRFKTLTEKIWDIKAYTMNSGEHCAYFKRNGTSNAKFFMNHLLLNLKKKQPKKTFWD